MTALMTKGIETVRGPLAALLSVGDLEEILKVDRRTIQRLRKQGVIPEPLRIGGSVRWRPDAIVAALDALERGRYHVGHQAEDLVTVG